MPALKMSPVPGYGARVWNVFMDVVNCRPKKRSPISWVELKAYLDLMDIDLDPWEINTLKRMDNEFIASIPSDPQQA